MRIVRWAFLALVFLAVILAVPWGTLALWFKLPGPGILRFAAAMVFALFGLATIVGLFTRRRRAWLAIFGLVFAGLLAWWSSLVPPADGNWAPEVARQVTGEIDGDILTLTNARAFEWRSADDVNETWETQSYDITTIEDIDLFMSYWGGPAMAHLMVSFGFADGRYLNWSVEVRRQRGGEFSPVADFFKANPIVIVAGEERDVIGLRSNIQKARVYMFRLNSTPDRARRLLIEYVRASNALAEEPRFFHSAFTNCSATVIRMAQAAGATVLADWRLIVNGHFPDYLYDFGALNSDYTLEDLYRLGDISERARAHGLGKGFSGAIRQGVPDPAP